MAITLRKFVKGPWDKARHYLWLDLNTIESTINTILGQLVALVQTTLVGATYITSTDQTASLPNSRKLVAGSNITLSVATPGQEIISATTGPDLSGEHYLTSADDHVVLPNSRQLLAGANITFNDAVANQRTISASGGAPGGNNGDVQYNNAGSFAGRPFEDFGYWAPLMNGDFYNPDFVVNASGEMIMVFTSLV